MSTVIVVKHNGRQPDRGLSVDVYYRLLEAGILALAGGEDIGRAWNRFLPAGTVGIKVNCLAKKFNSTPVALAEALVRHLTDHGRDANDIIVWERTGRELAAAGYTLNASANGLRCLGTDANGVGYGQELHSSGEVNSLVSRVLTDMVDGNINLPVLKDHSLAGMSGGMKNMYGAIHNPNKYHDGNCSPFCAQVNALEPIRTRYRLTITDAVRIQYNGGPGYVAQYMAYFGGVILSDDPVAADAIALRILKRLRADNGLPTLEEVGRPVRYLQAAEDLGLGKADPDEIVTKVLLVGEGGVAHAGGLF